MVEHGDDCIKLRKEKKHPPLDHPAQPAAYQSSPPRPLYGLPGSNPNPPTPYFPSHVRLLLSDPDRDWGNQPTVVPEPDAPPPLDADAEAIPHRSRSSPRSPVVLVFLPERPRRARVVDPSPATSTASSPDLASSSSSPPATSKPRRPLSPSTLIPEEVTELQTSHS
ncbi:vegetative cell wall protein gp1-like [Triticum aestivum]|uniref:vegetative cell wall protein gp1-like n=1 Tax=Triticum aestivum TaxID=4565 RepID=UPI001D02DE5E|nr:vegetative cell wall protein gp1-like [Triticum aestivum]